jgi:dienelactone hydrolase
MLLLPAGRASLPGELRDADKWHTRAMKPPCLPRRAAGALLAAALGAALPVARADPTGLQPDVVFGAYTPLAAGGELLRRTLTPLDFLKVQQALAQRGEALAARPLDLSAERFVLYVPSQPPPGGYALLVFVPPWHDARLPEGWGQVLDRFGMIYVSTARSGNIENVSERREPLALLAAYNVMQRYAVDPRRVYVGGFSGGSRVALRLAVAYPDLFHGALLDAGGDPFGVPGVPIPPAELMHRLQESSRLVFVTGEHDSAMPTVMQSRQSLHQWCVQNVSSQTTLGRSHEALDSFALAAALRLLSTPAQPDTAALERCRAQVGHELDAVLGKARSELQAGRRAQAEKLLGELDHRFGGLAAPESLELQQALDKP